MHIMLTDLQSISPEIQEIPAVADSGANSFAGMFHQQFPEVSHEGVQAIEFKEFFENTPLQLETSEITLEAPVIAGGQAPLIQVTTATEPDSSGLPEYAASQDTDSLKPVAAISMDARISTGVGELLPAGGNQLPQDSLAGTPVSRPLEIAAMASMMPTVAPPAIATVDGVKEQNPVPPAVLTRPATVQPSAALPGTNHSDQEIPNTTAADTIIARAPASRDVVVPKDQAVVPGTIPAIDRELSMPARPVTDSDRSRETGSTREPVAAVEVSSPGIGIARQASPQSTPAPIIAGREFRLPETVPATNRMGSVAKRSATSDTQVARQIPGEGAILHRDIMRASEPVSAREVTVITEMRGFEFPAQTNANAGQQSNAALAGHSVVAQVPGVGSVATVIQPNPLPPQLEPLSLAHNANSTEWGNGLGERVNWMINQKQNSASIRLDPPALGKLDVQIKIVDDVATISIQTQTLQTRDLIEAASIRLRDFLQESGFQNVNVDVSQRQDQQQARTQTMANTDADQDESGNQEQAEDPQQQHVSHFSGNGLVDTFA